jgi:hypothetical protein
VNSPEPDEGRYINPHEKEHLLLVQLSKYPPLTKKKIRRRYQDLLKAWRHDTVRRRYGNLIKEAEEYFALAPNDPDNAHLFFFQRNKSANPDDYLF